MSKSLLIKIKNLKNLQEIERKAESFFSTKTLNDSGLPELIWEQNKSVLSDIIGKDFNALYKDLQESKKGWTKVGFVPDEMLSVIAHSSESPQKVLNQIKALYKQVS